jgi:hypothetical protein
MEPESNQVCRFSDVVVSQRESNVQGQSYGVEVSIVFLTPCRIGIQASEGEDDDGRPHTDRIECVGRSSPALWTWAPVILPNFTSKVVVDEVVELKDLVVASRCSKLDHIRSLEYGRHSFVVIADGASSEVRMGSMEEGGHVGSILLDLRQDKFESGADAIGAALSEYVQSGRVGDEAGEESKNGQGLLFSSLMKMMELR